MELLDKEQLVRKRQRRATAASLSDFERLILPLLKQLPRDKQREVDAAVKQYKDGHRRTLEDLSNDAIDFMSLMDGVQINGEALHLRDVLHIRPHEAAPQIGAAAA